MDHLCGWKQRLLDVGHSLWELETHWSADDIDERLEWLGARDEAEAKMAARARPSTPTPGMPPFMPFGR